MTSENNSLKLDEQLASVVAAIDAEAGESDTSVIKSMTEFDRTEQVKYRLRKLEEAGFVTIENPGVGRSGRPRPLEVEWVEDADTDDLVRRAEAIHYAAEDPDKAAMRSEFIESMQEVERKLDALHRENQSLMDIIAELDRDNNELEDRVDELTERVEELEARLDD